MINTRIGSSHLLLPHACCGCTAVQGLQGGAGGQPTFMLQGDNKDLDRMHHQLLPLVGEQQVVVREAVSDGVIGAHHVEQRGEQREGMSREKQRGRGVEVGQSHVSGERQFHSVSKHIAEGDTHGRRYYVSVTG